MFCVLCSETQDAQAALALCEQYGSSPIILSGDQRLSTLGITTLLQQKCQAYFWNPADTQHSIQVAEQAKIGIAYAEYGVAESGSVVLFSGIQQGRAINLLPESTILVLRKSSILSGITQLADALQRMSQQGQRLPSCINIINGSSTTASIEFL